MILQKQLLNELRGEFNLNIYEVKIWTALLTRGIAAAGELSEISGVPRSRCYDVLETLERKGFVIMKLGKPIKYIAVKPEEVIERLKKTKSEDTVQQLGMVDDLFDTETFKDLELLYKQGIHHVDPNDLANSVVGRNNIYSSLKSLLETAEKSVLIVTTEEGLRKKMDILRTVFKRLNKKGVKINICAPSASKEVIKAIQNHDNIELKILEKIDARFTLVDDKEMFFMLNNDVEVQPAYDVGIWVKSPFFTKSISSLVDPLLSK